MNILHLLWIVPLSLTIGAFLTAVLIGGTRKKYKFDFENVQKK